jgi:hypothetical protein
MQMRVMVCAAPCIRGYHDLLWDGGILAGMFGMKTPEEAVRDCEE